MRVSMSVFPLPSSFLFTSTAPCVSRYTFKFSADDYSGYWGIGRPMQNNALHLRRQRPQLHTQPPLHPRQRHRESGSGRNHGAWVVVLHRGCEEAAYWREVGCDLCGVGEG